MSFEDNLLISSSKKVNDLKENPSYVLGYKTDWFTNSDILEKRNKYFVCPNRSSNKKHRFSLGCFFELKNLWDKIEQDFTPELLEEYNIREQMEEWEEEEDEETDADLLEGLEELKKEFEAKNTIDYQIGKNIEKSNKFSFIQAQIHLDIY